MHGSRIPFFAATWSAAALLIGSVSSLLFDVPSLSAEHVVEIGTAFVASGFLYFVRRWIAKQEDADRKVVDTLREEIERRQKFEREVSEFMGLVKGHLGLHGHDSDPSLLIEGGRPERRIIVDRRGER